MVPYLHSAEGPPDLLPRLVSDFGPIRTGLARLWLVIINPNFDRPRGFLFDLARARKGLQFSLHYKYLIGTHSSQSCRGCFRGRNSERANSTIPSLQKPEQSGTMKATLIPHSSSVMCKGELMVNSLFSIFREGRAFLRLGLFIYILSFGYKNRCAFSTVQYVRNLV